MDKPISVGDLVMVVRWQHDCVNPLIPLGKPFIVTVIRPTTGRCSKCGKKYMEPNFGAEGASEKHALVPLSWLKRIPPPDELGLIDEKEELHA